MQTPSFLLVLFLDFHFDFFFFEEKKKESGQKLTQRAKVDFVNFFGLGFFWPRNGRDRARQGVDLILLITLSFCRIRLYSPQTEYLSTQHLDPCQRVSDDILKP